MSVPKEKQQLSPAEHWSLSPCTHGMGLDTLGCRDRSPGIPVLMPCSQDSRRGGLGLDDQLPKSFRQT